MSEHVSLNMKPEHFNQILLLMFSVTSVAHPTALLLNEAVQSYVAWLESLHHLASIPTIPVK